MTLTAGATNWVEWAAIGCPIPGETSSGDGHLVVRGASRTLIAVMDGLGHGPEAHRATTAAIAVIAGWIGYKVGHMRGRRHRD